jgi:2-amino-4-hydroxy-6-hydroxymethyldihydropteridine diphosphokinase
LSNPLVVLGLGSNRPGAYGGPRAILEKAMADLEKILSSPRQASIRETEPLHVKDQPAFLNTAVAGFCALTPEDLLAEINRIEAFYGRDRAKERRWGERTLDIDILLYGDMVVRRPRLEIPHPRLTERLFALDPLLELLPEACDPVSGRLYRDIRAELLS